MPITPAMAALAVAARLHDKVLHARAAVADIIDGQPRRHDEAGSHPLVDDVKQDVVVAPVRELEDAPREVLVHGGSVAAPA